MLIRMHRGGYDSSMETVKEINTTNELFDFLKLHFDFFEISLNDLYSSHAILDTRNNWDTYYLVSRKHGVLAMTNENIKNLIEK